MAETMTTQTQRADETLTTELLPSGYQQVSRRNVTVDGAPAVLVRNERADGRNSGLGGEHVSWLLDDHGQLKGYVRMQQSLGAGDLPSKETAQAVALEFLQRAAPDLLESLELHWIAQHDEEIVVADNAEKATVTAPGMKVKMRNAADRRWFWVIVGTDGAPIVFERDIVWATLPGRRQTEKWLHDSWLASQASN